MKPDTPALIWHFFATLPPEERACAINEFLDSLERAHAVRRRSLPAWYSGARARLRDGDPSMIGGQFVPGDG